MSEQSFHSNQTHSESDGMASAFDGPLTSGLSAAPPYFQLKAGGSDTDSHFDAPIQAFGMPKWMQNAGKSLRGMVDKGKDHVQGVADMVGEVAGGAVDYAKARVSRGVEMASDAIETVKAHGADFLNQNEVGGTLGPTAAEAARIIHDEFHPPVVMAAIGPTVRSEMRDPLKALAQIQGRDKDMLKAIMQAYRNEYNRTLEGDFEKFCPPDIGKKALQILRPAMDLVDELETDIKFGRFWNTEDEFSMMDKVRKATPEQLEALHKDPEMLARYLSVLENSLGAKDLYEAKRIIYGEESEGEFESLLEFLQARQGDVHTMAASLMEYPPALRQRAWTERPDLFQRVYDVGYMSSSFGSGLLQTICTSTQAEAITAWTEYLQLTGRLDKGTVGKVANAAAWGVSEEGNIKTMLENGLDEAGDPLSEERRGELEVELERLGGMQENLMDISGEHGNPFLAFLNGTLSDEEFQSYANQMGPAGLEATKMVIRNHLGWIDNEHKVFMAIDRLPENLRTDLLADEDIMDLMADHMKDSEYATAQHFLNNDSYEIKLYKLENAGQKEVAIIDILRSFSGDERTRFSNEQADKITWLKDKVFKSEEEQNALMDLLRTGRFSQDVGLNYALGSREEMLNTVLDDLSREERNLLRQGYLLKRANSEEPLAKDKQNALDAFEQFMARLDQAGVKPDETQSALDHALGNPSAEDFRSEEGRKQAALLSLQRVLEKGNIKEEDSRILQFFAKHSEVVDWEEVDFNVIYEDFMADGTISESELVDLLNAQDQFDSAYDNYVNEADRVANLAGTAAAVVAGLVLSVATGGLASPLLAGLITSLGSTGAGIVARNAMGGAHEASSGLEIGKELGRDALISLITMGGSNLIRNFHMLQWQEGKALLPMTLKAINTSVPSVAGRSLGRRMLDEAVVSSLEGAAEDLMLTATDQRTWEEGTWNATLTIIKQVAAGIPANAAMGAGGELAGEGGDMIRDAGKPDWQVRVGKGRQFDTDSERRFEFNQVYLEAPGGGKSVLDSYDPLTGAIVSRKHTQLNDVKLSTAIRYLDEIPQKYPIGAQIADVASNRTGRNKGLLEAGTIKGNYFLEIPVPRSAIREEILDHANEIGITIRDGTGRTYN